MLKRCKECGLWFQPHSARQSYCKRDHYRHCPNCDKLVLVKPNCYNDPPRCCSIDCKVAITKRNNLEKYGTEDPGNSPEALKKRAQTNLQKYGCVDAGNRPEAKAKREQTNLKRYGVKNAGSSQTASEKRKHTNLDRYGFENAMQNIEVQQRSKQGLMDKYGVDNPRHIADYDDKVRQTSLEQYGTDYYVSSPTVRAKANKTNLERYGTIYPTQNINIQSKIRATNMVRYGVPTALSLESNLEHARERLKELYGVEFPGQSELIRERAVQSSMIKYGHPYPYSGQISQLNRHVQNKLTQLGLDSEFEFHIEDKSYDLHIVDTNILLEVDPTYTHNSIGNHWGAGLSTHYHCDKSELAAKYGYRCVHIFDWDNLISVLSMLIPPNQVIYARNCYVDTLNADTCDMFLDRYHLHGTSANQTVMYGLYYADELVEVMAFGPSCYGTNYEWELKRFCTKSCIRVVGGASRLFKHFLLEHNPVSVVSYCDRSKFDGGVYKMLGMHLDHVSDPSIHWSNQSKHLCNDLIYIDKHSQLLDEINIDFSNEQLMLDHGYLPVYDCGLATYAYEVDAESL